VARLAKQPLAPAYLFVGQEGYNRRLCREALLDRALPGEARADGLTAVDLGETTLAALVDDARSMSLFASERVIWVSSAELALPRRMAATTDEEEGSSGSASDECLRDYLKSPSPGTVIVFEASRYDFAGEDRPKLERVQKFFSSVPDVVEFRHFTPESSRYLAQDLAKKQGLKLGGAELAALLEAVAGDASKLASEMEKLSLFVGKERRVTLEDLAALVPNAAESTIFALVNALGKRDRTASLRSLDILIRQGEYLPLALAFLSTQFRLALATKESKITSPQQAQAFFTRLGVRVWRERAEQIVATSAAFTRGQLARAVALIYETDKKFREGYRDDRVIMEMLVLALTAAK
jgi:DNA polymerase-3 subunit delta